MPCFAPLVHRTDRWTVATKADARATVVGRAESSDLEGNVHMVPVSKVDEASLAGEGGSLDDGLPRASVEYRIEGRSVVQQISIGDLTSIATRPAPAGMRKAPADAWWRSYLAGKSPEPVEHRGRINYVDLFCASGGLSTGFEEAAMAFGLEAQSLMGVDMDARALQVYEQTHRPMATSTTSVDALVDFPLDETLQQQRLAGSPTILDPDLRYLTGKVDVVLAGPPCQGHSSLNNAMRYEDPRNRLYVYPAVIAIALGASGVVIENVPGVRRDRGTICQRTEALLEAHGYRVRGLKIKAEAIGWPQTRHRYFLVAVKDGDPSHVDAFVEALAMPARPISWAIEDLLGSCGDGVLDTTPELSEENKRRVEWLFEVEEDGSERFDLADSERPDCHRTKEHSYRSSYGRMRWDRPSGTLTTGFSTPGRGRFVHPKEPRVLTPHEAARIQGFPDGYFTEVVGGVQVGRTEIAQWIGDAVPAPLGFAASIGLVSQLLGLSTWSPR